MVEACGTKQVRLNRQYDTRLRRMSEQVQQGIQRLEDAGTTGDAVFYDLSPYTTTGTTTTTISAPTTTGQWFMRTIDTPAAVTYKLKVDFPENQCVGESTGGSPTEVDYYTSSVAGACLIGVSGQYKGNWSWYITKDSGFFITSEP